MKVKKKKPKRKLLKKGTTTNSSNSKIAGEKYYYIHSGDCYLYFTYCKNCKKKVGGWSPDEADKKWSEHFC
jgi:hypothetical protein